MAPPRPIAGNSGSRVRLIFGKTGKNWLLLTNEDDGNRTWQSPCWSGIPNEVARQLNNCEKKDRYAKEVDFGRTGAWYINGIKRDGTGGHAWWYMEDSSATLSEWTNSKHRLQVFFGSDFYGCESHVLLQGRNGYSHSTNIDDNLSERIKSIHSQKKGINFIRLFNSGGYFISDDEGTEWKGVGEHCGNELKKGGEVHELAVADDGSWVVIRGGYFESSTGVDKDLLKYLTDFYREQKARKDRRQNEIREYHESEAREAAERAERERREQEAAEQARVAADRAERDRQEAELKQAERQREEREKEALEKLLEERFLAEMNDIKEQEAGILRRKRDLHRSLEQVPASKRSRLQADLAKTMSESSTKAACVVCHDHDALHAVIPCGHHCLCDACTAAIVSRDPSLCPICRGNIRSTLKIFSAK